MVVGTLRDTIEDHIRSRQQVPNKISVQHLVTLGQQNHQIHRLPRPNGWLDRGRQQNERAYLAHVQLQTSMHTRTNLNTWNGKPLIISGTLKLRALPNKESSFIGLSEQDNSCTKESGSLGAKFSRSFSIFWWHSMQWIPFLLNG
jgi:hypothetical protein